MTPLPVSASIVSPAHDLLSLADTIRIQHHEAEKSQRDALERYRTVGNALLAAKALCKHGEWLPWLKANVSFTEQHARRYMRLAKSNTVFDLGEQWATITGRGEPDQDEQEPEPAVETKSATVADLEKNPEPVATPAVPEEDPWDIALREMKALEASGVKYNTQTVNYPEVTEDESESEDEWAEAIAGVNRSRNSSRSQAFKVIVEREVKATRDLLKSEYRKIPADSRPPFGDFFKAVIEALTRELEDHAS